MDISLSDVSWIYHFPDKLLSLDAPISDEDSNTLLEITENQDHLHPDNPISNEALKAEIAKAFETLSKKESEIIKMYYGIDKDRPATLEEIGKEFKLTRERVRQIKEKALIRLRHQSRARSLKQYLG
jgi:RNA polymerase primary sigma factor